MSDPRHDVLDQARRDAALTPAELWLRYFALGGMTSALDIEAALHGVLEPPAHDYNQIVHALNERFTELGRQTRLPYREDREDRDDPV